MGAKVEDQQSEEGQDLEGGASSYYPAFLRMLASVRCGTCKARLKQRQDGVAGLEHAVVVVG